MRVLSKLFVLSLIGFFAACSSGGDNKGDSGAGVTGSDKARWPETGDYNTSMTINGCRLEYKASSRAEYCVKLQDDSLDTCSARSSRERIFQNDCGGEFEPRNVKPIQMFGWDEYLQRQCEVSTDKRFPRASDLCAYYADESVHQGCFWQSRLREFKNLNCSGSFSSQPVKAEPTPRPTPRPQAPRDPSHASQFENLIAEFAEIGIQVKLGNSFGFPAPGEPSFYELQERVSGYLRAMRGDFASRTGAIKTLALADYTAYHPSMLTLGVGLSSNEIKRYLNFHDARRALHAKTGIEIDFGVEIFGSERGDKMAYLESAMTYFKPLVQNGTFAALAPLVKKIEISDQHAMMFFNSTLELHREKFQAELNVDLPLLKKLAQIASAGVEFEDFVYLDKGSKGLEQFAAFGLKNLDGFKAMRAAVKPIKIEVGSDTDQLPSFYGGSNILYLNTKSKFEVTPGLEVFMQLMPLIRDLKVEIDISSNQLDQEFIRKARALMSRKSALLAKVKLGVLKEVDFTTINTEYSYGKLYVGPDAEKSLDKAIASIKAR